MPSNVNISHRIYGFVLVVSVLVGVCLNARAQEPFVTDDADTTPKGHFHFELTNEFDWLQHSEFPSLRQNEFMGELDYGLLNGLEVGVAPPLISIFSANSEIPRSVTGLGDVNFAAKYNFLKEREHSRRPAMSIAINLEFPTGNRSNGLGSGLTDFYMNGVIQKTLNPKTTLHLNGGILFAGNQTTGVIGIRTRGTVFTAGGSLVKQFKPKLALGLELSGAVTKNFDLGKGQLLALGGGTYQMNPKFALNFALMGGKFVASPRFGAKVGIAIDF